MLADNADYRDIVRSSPILDADYVVLLMPIVCRSTTAIPASSRSRQQLEAIYASNRPKLPFLAYCSSATEEPGWGTKGVGPQRAPGRHDVDVRRNDGSVGHGSCVRGA